MSRRSRETTDGAFAVRGIAAALLFVLLGGLLVAKGAGVLNMDVEVTAQLPAGAGRVPNNSQVTYHGLPVGKVSSSDGKSIGDKLPGAYLTLQIGKTHAAQIPADAVVRAVPRTLFGDVEIDLRDPPSHTGTGLRDGAELAFDDSEEAVQLYDVYTRTVDVLGALEPEKLQTTMTALAQALDGRGKTLGQMIDDADSAGAQLMPGLEKLAEATPEIAVLFRDIDGATPELLETLDNATQTSQLVLDRENSIRNVLGAGLNISRSGSDFLGDNVGNASKVINDSTTITGAVSSVPNSLSTTIRGMDDFADKGKTVFATGLFDITAVPSFQDPMPYDASDCPQVGALRGVSCGNVVNVTREREQLGELQELSDPDSGEVAAATTPMWTMAAPMTRGLEVHPK